ncbi:MAG TPA: helical backbone metal receptor [Gammaproteobacteria bacterium]|nr:helical backbone metal receptor [Gammaproteobacteria bacterium]
MRFFLAAVFLAAAFPSFALTVQDDLGRTLVLPHPAKRMIVLAPDMVETVYAIGAQSALVGVVSGADYPLAARSITRVGSASGLDLERIASLHPDLILIWGPQFLRALQPFMRAGIPVYVNNPVHLQDVPLFMRRLGVLTGRPQAAARAATRFESSLKQITRLAKHHRERSVFFVLNAKPLMTVNGNNWISEAIVMCGGKNIFANVALPAPEVDAEAVLALNPDIIIKTSRESLPGLHQKTVTLPPDLIERAGPRLVEGVLLLCRVMS